MSIHRLCGLVNFFSPLTKYRNSPSNRTLLFVCESSQLNNLLIFTAFSAINFGILKAPLNINKHIKTEFLVWSFRNTVFKQNRCWFKWYIGIKCYFLDKISLTKLCKLLTKFLERILCLALPQQLTRSPSFSLLQEQGYRTASSALDVALFRQLIPMQ